MKEFELEHVSEVNAGSAVAAYDKSGKPMFVLEHNIDYEDMSQEQQEFAHKTSRQMVEHENLDFYLGRLEKIEDLDDLDLPVIIWTNTEPARRALYSPVDVEVARNNSDFDFYKLV